MCSSKFVLAINPNAAKLQDVPVRPYGCVSIVIFMGDIQSHCSG